MKKFHMFLTASVTLTALMGLSGAAFSDSILRNERLLGNNDDGVAQYRMMHERSMREHRTYRMHPSHIQPSAGDESADMFVNQNAWGTPPDGNMSSNAARQKQQWQYMQRNHPSVIEPAGGGYGNVPSQGTYNRFIDDPFGDIED